MAEADVSIRVTSVWTKALDLDIILFHTGGGGFDDATTSWLMMLALVLPSWLLIAPSVWEN